MSISSKPEIMNCAYTRNDVLHTQAAVTPKVTNAIVTGGGLCAAPPQAPKVWQRMAATQQEQG